MVHRHLQGLGIRVARPVAIVLTFLLVTIGWVFFRMSTVDGIGNVLAAMAGLHGRGEVVRGLLPYLLVGGVLMSGVPEEWTWRLPLWGPRRVVSLGAVPGWRSCT